MMKNFMEVGTDNDQFQKDIDHLRKMLQHFEETNKHLVDALAREKEIRKKWESQSLELKTYEGIVNLQNHKIDRSLAFFQNLQSCIQPSEQLLLSYFPDSCILQMQKDSTGGDVPWLYKKDAHIYVAVMDCSPDESISSAALSSITTLLLNNIVQSEPLMSPAEILDQLHHMFWNYLKQDLFEQNSALSVALSIIRINTKNQEIEFAGAHSDCMFLSSTESNISILKGNRWPIGDIHYHTTRKPYSNTLLSYNTGDSIYLCTNGLYNQLGGTMPNKFSKKRFVGFAKAKRHLRMQKFESEYLEYLDEWMMDSKQTDDILLLCIRF